MSELVETRPKPIKDEMNIGDFLRLRRYKSFIEEELQKDGKEDPRSLLLQRHFYSLIDSSYPRPSNACRFKISRTIAPVDWTSRPFMGGLCPCMKDISGSDYNSEKAIATMSSLRNALNVPEMRGNWFQRQFAYFLFIYNFAYRKKYHFDLRTLDDKVLGDERVEKAIHDAADAELDEKAAKNEPVRKEDEEEAFEKHYSRARAMWRTLKARFSNFVIDMCAWATFHILGSHWSSVQYHEGQIKRLKEKTVNSPHPVIYLPLHKSHFDYIIFTWLLYRTGVKMPIQAAGENLRIFLFGQVINNMGGYFIRRRMDPKAGGKDLVYRAMLETYVETLLREGYDLGFFLEGTRSRTGKPMIPKGGLLSAVVKAFREGVIEDAWLVPVSLSYERIVEGGYDREILGKSKIPESFFSTLWSTMKLFFGWKKCNMRMDIGEPIKLKDFHAKHEQIFGTLTEEELKEMGDLKENRKECAEKVLGGNARIMPRTYTGPLFGMDYVDERERFFVSTVAKHVIYDAGRCSAVMSTQVLATVVLYALPVKGASFSDALKAFDWLCEQIHDLKRDLGFRAENRIAMKYALNLWGKSIRTRHIMADAAAVDADVGRLTAGADEAEESSLWISVPSDSAALLDLSYQANNLVHSFYFDSVLATCLSSFFGRSIFEEREKGGYSEMLNEIPEEERLIDPKTPFCIEESALTDLALGLADLLGFETVLYPPCADPRDVIRSAIGRFERPLEILRKLPNKNEGGRFPGMRGLRELEMMMDSDEEEDESPTKYELLLTDTARERMEFFQRILAPILATYAYSMERAIAMGSNGDRFTEADFVDSVLKHINDKIMDKKERLKLSVNSESVKSSLKLWLKWRFLDSCQDDTEGSRGDRLFYHHESVAGDEAALEKMASRVHLYRL